MAESKSVVPPSTSGFATPIPEDQTEEQQKELMNEKFVRDLGEHPGWKLVVKHLEERIKMYENLQALLDETPKDDAEFRRKAEVHSTVARELRIVLSEVPTDDEEQ